MNENLRKRFMEGEELTFDEQETVSNWMYARGADLREIHQIADTRERYEELCQFVGKEPLDDPKGLKTFKQDVPNEWTPRDQIRQRQIRRDNLETLWRAGWGNHHISYRIGMTHSHVTKSTCRLRQNAGSCQ